MAIPKWARRNFDTLLRAAANRDLALLECTDAKTGAVRYVLTAMAFDGEQYDMTPFGHLVPNGYDAYAPPEDAP